MGKRERTRTSYNQDEQLKMLNEALNLDEVNHTEVLNVGNGSQIQTINISNLKPFPGNREIEGTDLDSFAENIKRNGFHGTIAVLRERINDETNTGRSLSETEKATERTGDFTGKYIIISGHRRVAALRKIIAEDANFMNGGEIPAIILNDDITWNQAEELNILYNNDTQSLSYKERKTAIIRLSELYKKRGLNDSEARLKVSEKLKIGRTQVYSYLRIQNELIPSLLRYFEDEKIDFNTAFEISGCSKELQMNIEKRLVETGKITKDEVLELKKSEEEAELNLKSKVETYSRKNEELLQQIEELKRKSEVLEKGSLEKAQIDHEIRRLSKAKSKNLKNLRESRDGRSVVKDREAAITKATQKVSNDIYLLQTKLENGGELSSVDKEKLRIAVKQLLAMVPDAF